MSSRRLAVWLLVAMMLIPATMAGAASQRVYLRGGGIPMSALNASQPTSSSVRNFDSLRNDDPGVTIRPGGNWATSSPTRYQEFSLQVDGVRLSGSSSLTVWSAVEDFEPETTGALEAYLMDCNASGGGCSLLATGSVSAESWNAEDEWSERTISFPAVDHTFAGERLLKVRIVVGNAADEDMWIAYDSVSTPSSLTVDLGPPPEPTTTTTTTVATTTTSTEPVGSTTTTTTPVTTTEPDGETTTTGEPNDGSTTTTAVIGTTTTSTAVDDQPVITTPEEKPPIAGSGGSVEIDRGGLITTGDGDVVIAPLQPAVRLTIGPLQRLAVSFGSATETIRATMLPALLLGAFAAVLVITLFEQARRDWILRLSTLVGKLPQTFQPLWMTLRSRMARRS